MSTTARAAAAVLLAAAGLLTAVAAPAAAALPVTGFTGVTTTRALPVIGSCPSGYHCLYAGGFSAIDQRKAFFASDPDFSNDFYPNGDPVNDNSASAANSSSGSESHYYANAGYGRFLFCLNPGRQAEYLWGGARDTASSLQIRPRTSIACLA